MDLVILFFKVLWIFCCCILEGMLFIRWCFCDRYFFLYELCLYLLYFLCLVFVERDLEFMFVVFVFVRFMCVEGIESFFSFINCVIIFVFLYLFLKLICCVICFFCGDFLLIFEVVVVWGDFWIFLLIRDLWI